jgi:hypothetical protein
MYLCARAATSLLGATKEEQRAGCIRSHTYHLHAFAGDLWQLRVFVGDPWIQLQRLATLLSWFALQLNTIQIELVWNMSAACFWLLLLLLR